MTTKRDYRLWNLVRALADPLVSPDEVALISRALPAQHHVTAERVAQLRARLEGTKVMASIRAAEARGAAQGAALRAGFNLSPIEEA